MYSDNEIKLFNLFGYQTLMDYGTNPITIYEMCVRKAFMYNMVGPHIEALRRGYVAIQECSAYRDTEKFEKLIEW